MQHNEKTTSELNDSQVIALCKVAGITWEPKAPAGSDYLGHDECFTGPISMDQMKSLLVTSRTFAAGTEDLIAGQRAALDSHYATREQIIVVLHSATDGPSRILAADKVLELLAAQPATPVSAPRAHQVEQALDQLEGYFNRESAGFAQCQMLRSTLAVGATRVQIHNLALEAAIGVCKASRSWADVDAIRAMKLPAAGSTLTDTAPSQPMAGAAADSNLVADVRAIREGLMAITPSYRAQFGLKETTLQRADALLARLSSTPGSDIELSAARWNAVLGSAYLRPLGCSGLTSPEPNNYAHLGLELWTKFDASGEDLSIEHVRATQWLTKYADVARAAQAESKTA
jgi:hypothetical protein